MKYLPTLEPRGELMLNVADVEIVDAWVATVLRTLIEYRARDQQVRVVLVPPHRPGPRLLLAEMLGEPPSKLIWQGTGGADIRRERDPFVLKSAALHSLARRALLPAQRLTNTGIADAVALDLPELSQAIGRPSEMRFVIGAFSEFVENALQHSKASPIGVIGSIMCDPRRGNVEAVVTDLGEGVPARAAEMFAATLREPPDDDCAGLADVVEVARRRDLDARVTIASNGNIFRSTGSSWTHHRTARPLPGFTAAVRVRW